MRLRALIWGVQDYEESPVDCKGDILLAQRVIAAEDAISFVNPDNVRVHIDEVDGGGPYVLPVDPMDLEDFVSGSKDPVVQAHWNLLQYHCDQLVKLRKKAGK
jgi:hypothetical protein